MGRDSKRAMPPPGGAVVYPPSTLTRSPHLSTAETSGLQPRSWPVLQGCPSPGWGWEPLDPLLSLPPPLFPRGALGAGVRKLSLRAEWGGQCDAGNCDPSVRQIHKSDPRGPRQGPPFVLTLVLCAPHDPGVMGEAEALPWVHTGTTGVTLLLPGSLTAAAFPDPPRF